MSDREERLELRVEDVAAGGAAALAAELREYLLDADPDLNIEQAQSEPGAQDFGATLIILLGTPAAIAVARGLKRWIERRSTSSVVVKAGKNEMKITNLSNRRAEDLSRELIELLRDR